MSYTQRQPQAPLSCPAIRSLKREQSLRLNNEEKTNDISLKAVIVTKILCEIIPTVNWFNNHIEE